MHNYFSVKTDFFGGSNPEELIKTYGSPLYVYSEAVLRQRCREMSGLLKYPNFKSNFSIKANSNLSLLKIIREEGLSADAMSPGEIHVLLEAGFRPEEILYIGNNVSREEMRYAVERNITVSIDSVSQLEMFGRLFPGGKVAVRFNPGVGAGHHEKVVTAGKKTKFGVNLDYVPDVKNILSKYNLILIGINQHIGSLFMEGEPYVEGVRSLLDIASNFEGLEFVDFGGGFGIPYRKQEGQERLDLNKLGEALDSVVEEWVSAYGSKVQIKIEPGRYIVAECGILLGSVYTRKQNYGKWYIGTDLGFNVLARPVMYDSYHELEVYRAGQPVQGTDCEAVTVVGNICETGDIMAKDRLLPEIKEGDILGVMDAGAYGYVMSSNYNNRLRPAEVLVASDGSCRLIRRRDTIEDIMRNFEV